jgi:EAL domain-containing protein (putative c-di-GMP-specific phosphodiesterase class I)
MSVRAVTEERGLPPVVDSVLHHAREHLDVDAVYLTEFRGARQVVRAVVGEGERFGAGLGAQMDLDRSYCVRMLTGMVANVVPDVGSDPSAGRLARRIGLPLGAYAGVPVRLPSGLPYGSLCCVSARPRPTLGPRDAQFLDVLAGIVADELQRERDELDGDVATGDRLRAAVRGEGLSVVFQPIIDLTSGVTRGVEALARFEGPPARPPDLWFAEAHRYGIGVELEATALDAAIRAGEMIRPDWYLSVNASPALLLSGRLQRLVADRIDPVRLVIEVTEHVAVEDYDALHGAIEGLREVGARLAVDDAGAGFASLHHIARLRPDIIKLDASLTRYVGEDVHYDAVTEALAHLAERSGASIVAEAVEAPHTLDALRGHGLASGQGYLFAAPAPVVDLRESYPVAV